MPKRLGELLVEANAVTAADVEAGLAQQASGQPERLGDLLVSMGRLKASALAHALARQSGLPHVELGAVPRDVADLLPLDFQVQNHLVPFRVEKTAKGTTLHVAVADPSVLDVVMALSQQLGHAVRAHVASSDQIEALHAAHQGHVEPRLPPPAASPSMPTAPVAPFVAPRAAPGPKLKVAIPPAPVKGLPRAPMVSTPAASPAVIPAGARGVPLPSWLLEPGTPTAVDPALVEKFELALAGAQAPSPQQALATVVALLVQRGLLREAEALDALGRQQ